MQQNLAPQDNLVLSGFLNSFKWNGQNQKAAWVYLAVGEKDMNDNRVYNSVLVQVYGNVARMLAAKQQERQNAKAQGQRMQVLVQITSGMVSSFTQQDEHGNDIGAPVTFIKGFKASIVNTQDRSVLDHSDNPIYNDPNQQNGGYQNNPPQQNNNQGGYQQHNNAPVNNAPQQNNQGGYQQHNNAPVNNAPQQNNQGGYQQHNNAPVNNAPQQNNQGGYQQHNNAPANNAPQQNNQGGYQPQNPNGHIEEDFDDDIPF